VSRSVTHGRTSVAIADNGSGLLAAASRPQDLSEPRILSHICDRSLPFSAGDITAGSENELQAAVQGARSHVDLAQAIEASNYFQNIVKRAAAGESSRRLISDLEAFVDRDAEAVWENSWVRLPVRTLTPFASDVSRADLVADKGAANGAQRGDAGRFLIQHNGEPFLRVPVSYALKLALAQAVSAGPQLHADLRTLGCELMDHFLNDNSSPETFSFQVVALAPETGMGAAIAKETARRFLLTQLLVQYANACFSLKATGQRAIVYFAPHPPVRQKQLNALISDSFYRELFMNPCLSGWNRGEDKLRYMHLCHEVMSRSQLNAVIRLKDAGIISRNLMVLPSTSNISLANNGTHLSLGSRVLTTLLEQGTAGFGPAEEKYLGDLVIKIVEHFLPLFVGTYSAAPYRMDFWDFHPEKALGFLPHELEATHVRMLWRRWKKKARMSVFGRPMTPVGPLWLDKATALLFGLRGDFVPDFRLLDYLVALHSTDQSPALDGTPDSQQRLKRDLAQLGVFDESMSLYLLYKQRAQAVMGFSGFEGRHYSLFESLNGDFAEAAGVQALLTALAFKYVADGTVTHADIPDDPTTESERRQFVFAAAMGVQACSVRQDTANRLMTKILGATKKTRPSRRYPGYVRVKLADYRRALVHTIEEDAADVVESLGLRETLDLLRLRLDDPQHYAASGKLTAGILGEVGATSPMKLSGTEFNLAAEDYYRETLRKRHLDEALQSLLDDLRDIDGDQPRDHRYRRIASQIIGTERARDFLDARKADLVAESLDEATLAQCIRLTLLAIQRDRDLVAAGVAGPSSC
jgi:hypothetical protein